MTKVGKIEFEFSFKNYQSKVWTCFAKDGDLFLQQNYFCICMIFLQIYIIFQRSSQHTPRGEESICKDVPGTFLSTIDTPLVYI
jgi:hypothetical protein